MISDGQNVPRTYYPLIVQFVYSFVQVDTYVTYCFCITHCSMWNRLRHFMVLAYRLYVMLIYDRWLF